ncbi:cupin domain-containing protein [Methylobacterium oryzisoli]|uniref:cupin domain-containing protein n=1 Tax=Methylobacterium oryzisoli TaxID=3385502 RepID=UPI003891E44A
MLTRRGFAGCVLCTLTAGATATAVSAQQGGITRTIIGKADLPDGKFVSILAAVELAPEAVIARHTHPGVEAAIVTEGAFDLSVDGLPDRTVKAGEGYLVPTGAIHSARNRSATTKLAITYTVEKDKPLASPA